MKRIKMNNERRDALSGFLFTVPWIIGFLYFFFIPFIKAIFYSFSSIKITSNGFDLKWVGFANYRQNLFTDADNLRLILTSVGDMLATVIVVVVFSLFMAIILNQKFFGRGFTRMIFALPIIISSGVIILLLKQNVLQQNISSEATVTIFQAADALKFLTEAGIPQSVVTFFENIVNNVFDMIWSSGMQIILFMSALQSIPKSSYEAAMIEGATGWESFWFVTFPMITPFLLVNVIYSVIDNFTDSTNGVMQKIATLVTGIKYAEASSLSMTYFLLVLMVVLIIYLTLGRKVIYTEM